MSENLLLKKDNINGKMCTWLMKNVVESDYEKWLVMIVLFTKMWMSNPKLREIEEK